MQSYRELIVWQKSMDLVVKLYAIVKIFPASEQYALSSQIKRCAISIPSNIAEGYGRNHTNDYVRFLQISSGSLYEFQTQLEIAFRLQYIDEIQYNEINSLSQEIERMLASLIRKLEA